MTLAELVHLIFLYQFMVPYKEWVPSFILRGIIFEKILHDNLHDAHTWNCSLTSNCFCTLYKLFFRRGPSWVTMTWLLTWPFYAVQLYQLVKDPPAGNIRFDFDAGFWSCCLALKVLYLIAHIVPNKPEFARLPFRYQRAIRRAGRLSDDEDEHSR